MRTSTYSLRAALPTVLVLAIGCNSDPVGGTADSGEFELHVAIVGEELDSDGVVATVGPTSLRLTNGQMLERPLAAGTHLVVISDLAANCTVDGAASFTVNVARGETVRATVTVICRRTVPLPTTLLLFSNTKGKVNPAGYLVALDNGTPVAVGSNGVATFAAISPGPHLVLVSGLPANCSVPDSSIAVNLPVEQTTSIRLDVTCQHPLTHRLAFLSSRASPFTFNTQLFVRSADGSSTTLIVPFFQTLEPRVSPDGSMAAYIVSGSLRVVNTDGSNDHHIYATVGNTIPRWSPDGQRLAFSSHFQGHLYLANADGTGLTAITPPSEYIGYPTWSPDGTRLAFFTQTNVGQSLVMRINVINADGSGQTNLNLGQGWERYPVWSPDGQRIAYTSTDSLNQTYLRSTAPDGTGDMLLYAGPIYPGPVFFSPDGSRIVLCADPGKVVVINADGTNPQVISSGWESTNCQAEWSPDGNAIGFLGVKGGNSDIYVIAPDGSGLVNATLNPASENRFSWIP